MDNHTTELKPCNKCRFYEDCSMGWCDAIRERGYLQRDGLDCFEPISKFCPMLKADCLEEKCAWWLDFAKDCSLPVATGILADSTISQSY